MYRRLIESGLQAALADTTTEGIFLRPAATLPVEMYIEERIREFDAAEAELAQALRPASKSPRGSAARDQATKRNRC